MPLALGHRQAIEMGPDAAFEHRVTVYAQVMWRDRSSDIWTVALNESDSLGRGDVFEHGLKRWEVGDYLREHALDENRLAIEDINGEVSDLPVDQ